MPTKTSRNAPCPCGSGKKYKKCCLAKDEAAEASVAVSEGAVARALGWLRDHYPDEFERAIALDYFDSLTPDQFEELDELPEDLLGMVHLNAFEWVLAEGENRPHRRRGRHRARDGARARRRRTSDGGQRAALSPTSRDGAH